MKNLTIILTTLIVISCKGTQNNQDFSSISPEVSAFLGSGTIDKVNNSSNTYQLITVKKSANGPLKYVVTNQKGAILLKETLRDGTVSWVGDNDIEVVEYLGVADGQNHGKKTSIIRIGSSTTKTPTQSK